MTLGHRANTPEQAALRDQIANELCTKVIAALQRKSRFFLEWSKIDPYLIREGDDA
jgi:hypothetical protein